MPDGTTGAMRDNSLGRFLRDRRTRLDPSALGIATGARRRTLGLRREEVAQRACISVTWYTLLEQGRGGPPSAEVLGRVAGALALDEAEREHLFLIGLGRPPEVRYRPSGGITPRLQAVLDAFPRSPALIRTACWDVIGWNRATSLILTDFAILPPEERNVLRRLFLQPALQALQQDWDALARFLVGAFRADIVRAGAEAAASGLVEELCRKSALFAVLWQDRTVLAKGEGTKRLRHPAIGEVAMDYCSFAVEGRPDLSMLVYNPATAEDVVRIDRLLAGASGPG
ncbi:helix-turn-helix transcriptional regulator [Acetobacteraceae bacterium KSS8]|uniref:Helix-turn-helix transcriptional regulator n=1 Tax=Endosaccharibacter trunci TaxID=2812733 RepID=A0ABT1W558_9PROT|nr:helix-turn-helix transcriptional regulator [Acetobacteraceae bacterium KSS8]